jgi:DnaJ-class molecular chaperone
MKKRQPPDAIEVKCDACQGEGHPPPREPSPGRRIYPAPCKKCGGKGRIAPDS